MPLYRAYSPSKNDHFYTTALAEYNGATQAPWDYQKEGIIGYVWLAP